MMKSLFYLMSTLSLALMFSSCASTKGGPLQQTLDQQEQYLSSGEYQMAIDGYNSAIQNYPAEQSVLENYARTLERIKKSADQAYKEKKYDSATQAYAVLSRNFHHFKSFEKALSFDSNTINFKLRMSRIEQSKAVARHALKSRQYLNAIEAYAVSLQNYPDDQALKKSFIDTVEEIHQTGERALKSGNLIVAGNSYSALLRKYGLFEKSAVTLPFNKKSVEDGLKQCRNLLTRKGLEQYRKGDLQAAISIWEDILKFDPDNVEIKKAIENAEYQLKKIKKESMLQEQSID